MKWLPAQVVAVLTITAMFVNLMFWGLLLLLPAAILKVLLPVRTPPMLERYLTWIAGVAWVGGNHSIYAALHGRRRNVLVEGVIDPSQSWLIVANHQSWADILILFDVFHRRVSMPRFFLKRELLWMPLVGFLCWALDMPFMRRNSKAAIARNPALKNDDLETTRRFCEKYRGRAITVVNYLEGTRCSEVKRIGSGSPYRHLLKPKSGGLSFTLNAMGEQFAGLVDMTLVYQPTRNGRSKLWSFLCGEQSAASVRIRVLPLPVDLLGGDYQDDAAFRERFQHWVNLLWAEKDAAIDAALAAQRSGRS